MPPNDERDSPGVIAFPPLIWLIGAVLSVIIHLLWPHSILAKYGVALAVGIALAGLALALALWAMRTMRQAGTNVNPSEPALTIVRQGPYRFTRNPMYLALCLLLLGLGFILNDWLSLAFVVPLFLILHYGVILREERYLEAKFGGQYLALKREVRRWV